MTNEENQKPKPDEYREYINRTARNYSHISKYNISRSAIVRLYGSLTCNLTTEMLDQISEEYKMGEQ